MVTGLDHAREILARVRNEDRTALLEHEGYALLGAFGLRVPKHRLVSRGRTITAADLEDFAGTRIVVKAVSPALLHKSDAGGVALVDRTLAAVHAALARMRGMLAAPEARGVLLVEYVPHDPGAGELLVGLRVNHEFGPVLTIGTGGIHAEFFAEALKDEGAIGVLPAGSDLASARAVLRNVSAVRLATEPHRGAPPSLAWSELEDVVDRLLALGKALPGLGLVECEINPLAISAGRLVPLDVLVTLGAPASAAPERPLGKMPRLLAPRSLAIVGVSEQLNPGRIILRNVLAMGFPRERIVVIKPGRDSIDGCRCVPTLAHLPAPVDLVVVAVAASQVPPVVEDITAHERAESVIVIPGGLEETGGGAGHARRLAEAIAAARATPGRGPLLVGGNCLGVRSVPGRYDTLFIPREKLPRHDGPPAPIAVVAQSGAFAISRVSRWSPLGPRHIVTLGNQADVTIGDVLESLACDSEIAVFAVYVEGFRPLDGVRLLRAIAAIRRTGRDVVLYRAGRTQAGREATASHTAAIAGDYRVTRLLAEQAGALVAESLDEFDDLVQLALAWRGRRPPGGRIGIVSNAGFECVAFADSIGSCTLAPLAPDTMRSLRGALAPLRIDTLVDVRNPLDVTPMANEEVYEAAVRAMLADPGVDVCVVGCVPLTAALQTLPAGGGLREDVAGETSLPARLGRIQAGSTKPIAVVVDAGPLYDTMRSELQKRGLPVFSTADRALRTLARFISADTLRTTNSQLPTPKDH